MFRKTASLVLFSALVGGTACHAQGFQILGSGGYGLASTYSQTFDTRALVTFSGRITGITTASPMAGVGASNQIIVKAKNGGSMLVELGPSWYVSHQSTKLHVGDWVTVSGSKVMLDHRGSVMAQQIVKGNGALVLRSSSGIPYWTPTYAVAQNVASAAQPIVGTAAQQRVPILDYGQQQQGPIYATPTVMNGTIRGFNVQGDNVYMTLDTGTSGVRTVYLGPTWFLERQDVNLQPGQIISMNALTPITNSGQSNMAFAQTLNVNGTVLTLRNQTGGVAWYPNSGQLPVFTLPNGIGQSRVGPSTPQTGTTTTGTAQPGVGPRPPRQ